MIAVHYIRIKLNISNSFCSTEARSELVVEAVTPMMKTGTPGRVKSANHVNLAKRKSPKSPRKEKPTTVASQPSSDERLSRKPSSHLATVLTRTASYASTMTSKCHFYLKIFSIIFGKRHLFEREECTAHTHTYQGCHWSEKTQGNSRSGKNHGILELVRN